MEIIDYYDSDNKEHWLLEIEKCDWRAGKYLYELLRDQKFKKLCGESTKVLMLVDDDALLSFCTYAEQDDVREPSLTPWVGFVYTFPKYRGRRYVETLLDYVYMLAKYDEHEHIYISTGEIGLYEKYGYHFWRTMKNVCGEDTRVYKLDIATMEYSYLIEMDDTDEVQVTSEHLYEQETRQDKARLLIPRHTDYAWAVFGIGDYTSPESE